MFRTLNNLKHYPLTNSYKNQYLLPLQKHKPQRLMYGAHTKRINMTCFEDRCTHVTGLLWIVERLK